MICVTYQGNFPAFYRAALQDILQSKKDTAIPKTALLCLSFNCLAMYPMAKGKIFAPIFVFAEKCARFRDKLNNDS